MCALDSTSDAKMFLNVYNNFLIHQLDSARIYDDHDLTIVFILQRSKSFQHHDSITLELYIHTACDIADER